jgi:hypothetical protein
MERIRKEDVLTLFMLLPLQLPEGAEENHEKQQNSGTTGSDLILRPLEYSAGVLNFRLRRAIKVLENDICIIPQPWEVVAVYVMILSWYFSGRREETTKLSSDIVLVGYLSYKSQNYYCRGEHDNQLSGYDVLTRHAVLFTVVSMLSLLFTHVPNYTAVDITTVSNANLYISPTRSSSYFRV